MDTRTLIDLASSWKYIKELPDEIQSKLGEPDGYYCPWENGRDFPRLELPNGISDEHRHLIRDILEFWVKQPNIYHDSVSYIVFCWKTEPILVLKNSLVVPSAEKIVHVIGLDCLLKFEMISQNQIKRVIGEKRWLTIGWGLIWAGFVMLIQDFKRF